LCGDTITDTISYSISLSVGGGPALNGSGVFQAEAWDNIEASIPKGSVATRVNIQPGDLANVKGIIILASAYSDLTFTVDEGVDVFTLSAPLCLIGAGLLGIFGATLNDIVFTNANSESAVDVTILVARTAIEPELG